MDNFTMSDIWPGDTQKIIIYAAVGILVAGLILVIALLCVARCRATANKRPYAIVQPVKKRVVVMRQVRVRQIFN